MSDSGVGGARPDRFWAGTMRFPRTPADLRSTTTCPACFALLRSTTCGSCDLDLTHPATAELAALSTRIADDLDARADLVGRIRRETAERASARPIAAPATATAPEPAPSIPPPAATTPEPTGKRRSSIQIALVVVGISLLAVFAVFGLVYAFVTYGESVRMLIIGAGTLATLAAAAVLSRRGLTATAEGIAALGTIVLVLDAWALRLNDPAGLGSLPERGYWGVALLIVGVVAAGWSRWGRLASPAVAAATLLPIGAGLATAELVAQLSAPLSSSAGGSLAVFLGALAAVGTSGLSGGVASRNRPATRRAAHIVARSVGALAATVALVGLLDLLSTERFAPLLGGLALGGLAVAHLASLAREAGDRRSALDTLTAVALGSGSALAALIGVLVTTLRVDQDRATVSMPLLAAVVIALVGEQLWRRSSAPGVWRTGFASGTIAATAAAVVAAALAGLVAASAFAEAATAGIRVLPGSVRGAVATPEPAVLAALGALALSAALLAASWTSVGRLRSRARALGPALAVIIVLAVPLAGPWWLVMLLLAVLSVGGVIALRVGLPVARGDDRGALVAALAPLIIGSAFGAFAIGWAVQPGWMLGLTVALLAILLARTTSPHRWARGLSLGAAAALVVGVAGAVESELTRVDLDWGVPTVALLLATVLLLAIALGRLEPVERLAAGGVALAGALLALVVEPDAGVPHVAATAALLGALTVLGARGHRIEQWAARIVLPLVVVRGGIALADDRGLADLTLPLALSTLVIVAAIALAVSGRQSEDARLRLATDVATGAVGATVLALALLDLTETAPASAALALLVAAVVTALTATSADGLVGSSSPRRHLGWLAVALAAAALWTLLLDSEITQLEAFVLPVAGTLLLIAALIARAGRGTTAGVAIVVSAALGLALLPLAAVSGIDAPWRLIVVGVLGAVLAVLPLAIGPRLDAAFRGLALGMVVVGLGSVALLTAAQVVRLGELVGSAGGAALPALEQVRIVLLVAVLAALALLAWFAAATPARHAVAATAAGLAAAVAGLAGVLDAVHPVELVSAPLALGLLGIGTLQLGREERARSWPWLGPGILVLLVPSLLAIDGAGEPLWRAIALGVVAALVFVLALQRRLQALFVLGGAVLLTHLLVQSWPLLEQVGRAVEWWIWLGLAGIVVVLLAARYERRVQNVRTVARRIADLR
ncbi:SCO7613 C-terminal domain-containing membrane protein [Microcella indica]|uniref:SCO7613 C-terminal domain-containing membrane protein n=1 Tax=Microcella indica TaxID=2750620 RepID=UPI0015CF53A3|nr:hypothetical protein [Microcella indica]